MRIMCAHQLGPPLPNDHRPARIEATGAGNLTGHAAQKKYRRVSSRNDSASIGDSLRDHQPWPHKGLIALRVNINKEFP